MHIIAMHRHEYSTMKILWIAGKSIKIEMKRQIYFARLSYFWVEKGKQLVHMLEISTSNFFFYSYSIGILSSASSFHIHTTIVEKPRYDESSKSQTDEHK